MSDVDLFGGPGQWRATDPDTARMAAGFVTAKATTARVRLMEAHALWPQGLTDEEAADVAGLVLTSEYATRCSELHRMGFLEDTGVTRSGRAGAERMVRRISTAGLNAVMERRTRAVL